MYVEAMGRTAHGALVPIAVADDAGAVSEHWAFAPHPLSDSPPALTPATHQALSHSYAALASLESVASRLPDASLLREPTVLHEVRGTAELEGTLATPRDLAALDLRGARSADLQELSGYARMTRHAFHAVDQGRPVSTELLDELHQSLAGVSGGVREVQVVVGRRPGARPNDLRVRAARFVPLPPGELLEAAVTQLADWMQRPDPHGIDPVVCAAMSHYQFDALRPYAEGSGPVARLLIPLQLLACGALSEPVLTMSCWLEEHRTEYFDRLFAVSASGDWDGFVRFFAGGVAVSSESTARRIAALIEARHTLAGRVLETQLGAESARLLVDLATACPGFTVRDVAGRLALPHGRADALVSRLVGRGVVEAFDRQDRDRGFYAPTLLSAFLGE